MRAKFRANAWVAAAIMLGFATAPQAETDLFNLSHAERQVLGQAIREVLVLTPELLRRREPSIAAAYDAEIASDQALIRNHGAQLFSDALPGVGRETAALKIAFLSSPGCKGCAKAERELKELALRHDLRVYVIDVSQRSGLEESLGVDTLPFYVLPRMMLRGAMPQAVLDRYLSSRTGQ